MSSGVTTLVLAAGLSSRMTPFKPLAPLAGPCALERVVRAHQAAGVERILVVTGHRAQETAANARELGAVPVRNPDYELGMFSSVQAGVRALGPDCALFLLHPVDIPLVRPATLARLLAVGAADPKAVLYPCFRGQRGHPPVLPSSLAGHILAWSGALGLRGLLQSMGAALPERDLAVADEGVLRDMDTDDEFARLDERAGSLGLPSPAECEALLDLAGHGGATSRVRLHGRAVGAAARALIQARNGARKTSAPLNEELAYRAGLLHDIAKGSVHHEAEGGRLLAEHGFSHVAAIVAAHRDIDPAEGVELTEREAVFLADKLLAGCEQVALDERYGRVLARHGEDPEARAAIVGRRERARAIYALWARETGQDPGEVVGRAMAGLREATTEDA